MVGCSPWIPQNRTRIVTTLANPTLETYGKPTYLPVFSKSLNGMKRNEDESRVKAVNSVHR
jgi:hypothetical protein